MCVHDFALFIYLFMFRGPWACTWAGFMWEPPFQLIMCFSIGPSLVGCMLSTSGKCVPSFKKNVFRTINSMRYVRYGALKDWTVQRLPKHCVCRSNNTFIQPTDEIYYWLYIENNNSSKQTKYTTDCTRPLSRPTSQSPNLTGPSCQRDE